MMKLAASILGAAIAATASAFASPDRPNIVWLVSEDSSKHYFRLFDEGGARTPRIDELAAEGVVFTRAFSNSPVCSVARTTLITGCYAPRIGTQFHRKLVAPPLPDGLRMFPAYLREAGYYTTNRSKKDYNAQEGPGVWDESSKDATWRDRQPGQPFFHMQSFADSHESSLHFSAEQMARQNTVTDPASVSVMPYHPDTPTFRGAVARYHDRIQEVDRQIGAVIDQLAEDDLLETTFIFFFGDHGGVLPGSKGYLTEAGLHVPLVVRVPERFRDMAPFARGVRSDGFVSFVDFGPTGLALAGIDPPDQVDGRAFLGIGIAADDVAARDETFGYADRFDEKYDLVRSLRKGNLKYVRSFEPFLPDALQNNYRYQMLAYQEWRTLFRNGALDPVQRKFFEPKTPEALYDLATDPHETLNLAAEPDFRDELLAMRRRLHDRLVSMPDLSFYPESVLVDQAMDDPVEFGMAHQDEIKVLAEVADLALVPFSKARPRLETELSAANPWRRFWALIACSSHGAAAAPLAPKAAEIARADPNRLVRVRAAEFLALIGHKASEAADIILSAIRETLSPAEAAQILNTIANLSDRPATRQAIPDITEMDVRPEVRGHDSVARRLDYLAR